MYSRLSISSIFKSLTPLCPVGNLCANGVCQTSLTTMLGVGVGYSLFSEVISPHDSITGILGMRWKSYHMSLVHSHCHRHCTLVLGTACSFLSQAERKFGYEDTIMDLLRPASEIRRRRRDVRQRVIGLFYGWLANQFFCNQFLLH